MIPKRIYHNNYYVVQKASLILTYHSTYQNGNTDAFKGLVFSPGPNIDQPYVDGVSLTHGSVGSRQHIWSFASALGEEGPFRTWWLCACSNGNNWPHSTLFKLTCCFMFPNCAVEFLLPIRSLLDQVFQWLYVCTVSSTGSMVAID